MRLSFLLARSLAVVLALVAFHVMAAPYRPQTDSEIVETLPAGTGPVADRATRALRAAVARDPNNLDIALRLAGLYIARARIDADPRQLGRAQAVLAPWWSADAPPVPVLVLRATIEQSNHVFAAARADLERAVEREPNNAQAWLTLSTVQQVTGDLAGAAESCRRLADIAIVFVAVTCKASVDGLSGRAAEAYDSLGRMLAESPAAHGADAASLRTWAMTLQAEIAERLARPADAERLFRASRALDPRDAYTIAAYADFLLDAERYAEVIELIPRETPIDTLLLRRVQAAQRSGSADAKSTADDLSQRFAALRARGDRVHLREEARYTLEIRKSPDAALALAIENWRVQKEPLDARIALEAALAAHRPEAAAEVLDWIASTQIEDARLAALAQQAHAK
jgi:hypothetical protein